MVIIDALAYSLRTCARVTAKDCIKPTRLDRRCERIHKFADYEPASGTNVRFTRAGRDIPTSENNVRLVGGVDEEALGSQLVGAPLCSNRKPDKSKGS